MTHPQFEAMVHETARNIVYSLGADPGSITSVARMIRDRVRPMVTIDITPDTDPCPAGCTGNPGHGGVHIIA